MSQEQKINGNITPIIQAPINGPNIDTTNAKALKALLYELEQLLAACTESASADSSAPSKQGKLLLLLQNDPAKFAELIKRLGKDSTESPEFHEIVQTISAYVASTKGYDNSKVAQMLQELVKGTSEEKESAKFGASALKMFDIYTKGVESGKTTLEEGFTSPEMKAFIGEFMNGNHGATSKAVRVSLVAVFEGKKGDDEFIEKVIDISVNASVNKTSDGKKVLDTLTSPEKLAAVYNSVNKEQALNDLAQKALPTDKDQSYTLALMKMAVSLAGLLGNVMESQTTTSEMNTQIIKKQGANAKTIAINNISALQTELAAEAKAGQEPWYMYVIAAVMAVVAAAVTFFTCGTATPAIIALFIGLVMASPAGGAITGGLSKAIGGGTDSPGSEAAAAAIVTVITTILSLGAAGFATAGEEVVDNAVSSGLKAGAAAADAGSTAGGSAATAATDAVALESVEEITENVTTDAISTNSKTATSGLSKFMQLVKDKFDMKWSQTALTAGIKSRAIGSLLQGFLGSGGVTDTAEAIAIDIDPKVMDNYAAAITFAVVGAVVAVAGSYFSGEGLTNVGVKLRAEALELAGLADKVIRLSKPMEMIARGLQAGGTIAQSSVTLSQASQEMQVANLQQLSTATDAALAQQKYVSQQANDVADNTTKAYSDMIEGLNDTLNQALQAVGIEEQNNKRNASR